MTEQYTQEEALSEIVKHLKRISANLDYFMGQIEDGNILKK